MIRPDASRTGEIVNEMLMRRPFLERRTVSKCSIRSPRRSLARIAVSSGSRSFGIMMVIGRPTASAALYSNSRSAPPFQEVMMPSSVLLTIASSDDSTMAASSARFSSACFRSVMSSASPATRSTSPGESEVGKLRSRIQRIDPSGARFGIPRRPAGLGTSLPAPR